MNSKYFIYYYGIILYTLISRKAAERLATHEPHVMRAYIMIRYRSVALI